ANAPCRRLGAVECRGRTGTAASSVPQPSFDRARLSRGARHSDGGGAPPQVRHRARTQEVPRAPRVHQTAGLRSAPLQTDASGGRSGEIGRRVSVVVLRPLAGSRLTRLRASVLRAFAAAAMWRPRSRNAATLPETSSDLRTPSSVLRPPSSVLRASE